MITHLLLVAAIGVVEPWLLLVGFTAPTADMSGLATVGSMLASTNRYLPVDAFVTLTLAGLAFDLVLSGAHFLVWLWRLIPGKAT